MATNTMVLIVVTAMALLLLAGAVVGVVYKTRTQQRHSKRETIRDQAGRPPTMPRLTPSVHAGDRLPRSR